MKQINVIRALAFAILVGYVFGLPAQAAGLDCTKAKSKAERLICDHKKNPGLYSLDGTLNIFYDEARQRVAKANARTISEEQRKWLKDVRDVCDDAECLTKVYRKRVGELQQIATLCKPEEIVIFSCSLKGGKAMSLCASSDVGVDTGYMQFRMGASQQSIELEYPQKLSAARNHFQFIGRTWTDTAAVAFSSSADRYFMFNMTGRYAEDRRSGVVVSNGALARVSYQACTREPILIEGGKAFFATLDRNLELPDADDEAFIIEKAVVRSAEGR